MTTVVKFEADRLLLNRTNLLIFLCFLLVSLDRDFAALSSVLASLFMLFMGWLTFRSDSFKRFVYTHRYTLSPILIRLLLLDLVFAAVFRDRLPVLALLTFFYTLGLLMAVLSRNRHVLTALALWFALVFLLPELYHIYLNKHSSPVTGRPPLIVETVHPMAGPAVGVLFPLIFLTVGCLVLKRRLNRVPEPREVPHLPDKAGESYFILCRDIPRRDRLFRFYAARPDTAGVDHVAPGDIDTGVPPNRALRYLSSLRGVDEEVVKENLRVMGIKPEDLKTSRPPADLKKKLYAAILTAAPQQTLIINDFLYGESGPFEKAFLSLVVELKKRGKMVVYLGKRKLYSAAPIEERVIKYNDYLLTYYELENTSLR
jgi:hypothetical protein